MKNVLPWIVAAAMAVLVAWMLINAKTKASDAERLAELANLRAKDFETALQLNKLELEVKAGQLEGVRSELDRLKKESPGVKIRTVIKWRTVYLPVSGTPRPEVPGTPPPLCVLAQGDEGQVRVNALRLETKLGNMVAIGNAQAVRVKPLPETVLFGGPFSAALSEYSEAKVEPQSQWTLGAGVWWTNPGYTLEVEGSYRLAGPFWLTAGARFDNQYAVGARWEFH